MIVLDNLSAPLGTARPHLPLCAAGIIAVDNLPALVGTARPHLPVYKAGIIVVDDLPALVGTAPVVALAHPGGVSAVEVPGVGVAEDDPVPVVNELGDHLVCA